MEEQADLSMDTSPDTHSHARPDGNGIAGGGARHSMSKARVRVTRACDRCKSKKAKCNGTQPCSTCAKRALPCRFEATYTRGRAPVIRSQSANSEHDQLEPPATPGAAPALALAGFNPGRNHGEIIHNGDRSSFFDTTSPAVKPATVEPIFSGVPVGRSQLQTPQVNDASQLSSRNSPEPFQTDLQGHYIGPSSGVAFLLRAQKRLHEANLGSADASIFTFGDSPLPQHDPSFLILPSKAEASKLVRYYFEFGFPTHRFLHQPTVEQWLESMYASQRRPNLPSSSRSQNAVILMIMSHASALSLGPEGRPDIEAGASFFAASEHQLALETGEIRLTSIQARLAQCFYLLSQSRINQCWSLFGSVARLAQALGIHRRKRKELYRGGGDLIEAECRKRVFWSAYSLDIYLSAILGRPKVFHDDDHDQELPLAIDDVDIRADRILSVPGQKQSVMLASVYHAKLCGIVSGALKDLYGIRRLRAGNQVTAVQNHANMLQSWHIEIASFLEKQDNDLNPLFGRQREVLNFAYAHAYILIHRPFLLSTFASLARPGPNSNGELDLFVRDSIQGCKEAAETVAVSVIELCETNRMFGSFWFTQYCAFCALVVLYIHAIQRGSEPTMPGHENSLDTAQKCQDLLSKAVVKSNFAQRYGIVLEELRSEALAHSRQRPPELLAQPYSTSAADDSKPAEAPSWSADTFNGDYVGLDNASPSSWLADMTGWGEFDSLVMAGTSDFDALFGASNSNYGPPTYAMV